jgi:hypothetical protein
MLSQAQDIWRGCGGFKQHLFFAQYLLVNNPVDDCYSELMPKFLKPSTKGITAGYSIKSIPLPYKFDSRDCFELAPRQHP